MTECELENPAEEPAEPEEPASDGAEEPASISARTVLILIFTSLGFMLLSGVFFSLAERPTEQDNYNTQLASYNTLKSNLALVAADYSSYGVPTAHIDALTAGINALPVPTDPKNWQYCGSVYFVFTLMTTIGYGNFAPLTNAGRGLVMLVGFFGILLLGITVAAVQVALNSRFGRFCERHNRSPDTVLRIWILASVLWILVSGVCYHLQNGADADYLESIYYSFVTFSTIGLGDFTPQDYRTAYGLLVFVLNAFGGLLCIASLLSQLSDRSDAWMAAIRQFCCGCSQQQDVDEEHVSEESTAGGQPKPNGLEVETRR